MFRQTVVFLCCVALVGCQTAKIKFYDDRAAMEREVAALVPPGTPLAEAKKTMKANGFTCVEGRDAHPAGEETVSEPFLRCEYTQMTGIFGNYQVSVQFPCSEVGWVGEGAIGKLTASRGLAKDLPASGPPQPIEPAPLWTKVVAGTGMAALIVITLPMMCLALGHPH